MEAARPKSVSPVKAQEAKQSPTPVKPKTTKLGSCRQVYIKNGQAVATPFPMKLTGYKARNSYVNMRRSSETTSFSHEAFKVRPTQHAGMRGKPLERYSPHSLRNRMPTPTIVMPYKNSSQVCIGDTGSPYKRQYVTTAKNTYKTMGGAFTQNQGIIAERVKWRRHVLDQ